MYLVKIYIGVITNFGHWYIIISNKLLSGTITNNTGSWAYKR
jgi:hypothetical protein